ncbi:MAG TPA: PKD domain-containing protein, partial [Flavitalea sp.]|nr:PKD domain-containing protein [Flavitalea sp.]
NTGTPEPPANKAPVSRAGADIHLTLPNNQVTIDGSASSDEDGSIRTYLWTKQSGPAQYRLADPNSARTELSQLVEGLYMFRLTVTDDKGATHFDVLDVYVHAPETPANKPPVAKAGNDIVITLPLDRVTLNGNGSSDEDGSIISYAWSKISGPSSFHIANPNGVSTQALNLTEGEYQFTLRVTDDKGATDTDTVRVTVNPAPVAVNQAPAAQAGSNRSITLPENSVSLDGRSSSDPDGTIVRYTWSYVSGPSSWSIDNANNAVATARGLTEGSYYFRLEVEDDKGATDADTMIVAVNSASVPPPAVNQGPTAVAGADITITLPTDHVVLNGSASTDPDGTIASYLWSKLSGPAQYSIVNANAASTEVQQLAEGEYQFKLEVKDNEGAVHADTIKLTVLPAPNMAPIADAGKDFQVSLPDPMIQLNGLASNDPDGEIVSYQWVRISGPGAITIINSNTATPRVIGVSQGEYVFELTVTDEKGATATDRVKVTVITGNNDHPLAAAGPDQIIESPSTYALLNGGDSYDADGRLVSYTWRQLSGPSTARMFTPNEVITEVENLEIGEYVFELTVVDDRGSSSVDKVSIVVTSPASNLRYEETVRVYPNPARSSSVNLRFNSDSTGRTKITIYAANGTPVQSIVTEKPGFDFNKNIDVVRLKAGLYYVEIIVADKQKMATKFIKQ